MAEPAKTNETLEMPKPDDAQARAEACQAELVALLRKHGCIIKATAQYKPVGDGHECLVSPQWFIEAREVD